MTEEQIQTTLALWSLGRDTKQIASVIGVDEAIVANELPKLLEQRRSPPSPRTQKSAVQLHADKLRRCGMPKHVIDLEVAKMEAKQ
jgi:hypothetical protein